MLEKKIPKTLEDCYKINGLVARLYKVADIIKIVGKVINILPGIVLGVGFISILVIDMYAATKFGLIMSIVLGGAIVMLSVFVSAFLLSLGVEAVASIVLHTRISANVALYNAKRVEEGEKAEPKVPEI